MREEMRGTRRAFLEVQMVKNLPAMQETWVQSLGQEDPLEEGTATHSSVLAGRIPWIEETGGLQSVESQRVGQDWAANTFTFKRAMREKYIGRWEKLGSGEMGRGDGKLVFSGNRVSISESEKFGRRMMVRVPQQCACTYCHWTVNIQLNFTVNIQLNMVKIVCSVQCNFYRSKNYF